VKVNFQRVLINNDIKLGVEAGEGRKEEDVILQKST
jgi:hypothetical protein